MRSTPSMIMVRTCLRLALSTFVCRLLRFSSRSCWTVTIWFIGFDARYAVVKRICTISGCSSRRDLRSGGYRHVSSSSRQVNFTHPRVSGFTKWASVRRSTGLKTMRHPYGELAIPSIQMNRPIFSRDSGVSGCSETISRNDGNFFLFLHVQQKGGHSADVVGLRSPEEPQELIVFSAFAREHFNCLID